MRSLIPLILIGICVGAYYMYIGPTFSEIQTLSLQKSEYVDALEKIQSLAEKRDKMREEYNTIPQVNIDRLKKIIPEEFSSVAVANDINTIAGHSGMTIEGFKVSEPAADPRERVADQVTGSMYKTYLVSFRVKGQYSQFIRFLREVETNAVLSDIHSISVNPETTAKGASTDFYDYGITFSTYSLR